MRRSSRSLRALATMGRLSIAQSPRDCRTRDVDLTDSGLELARRLACADRDRVRNTLEPLPRRQKDRVVRAMQAIREIEGRHELANLLDRLREQKRGR